MTPARACQPLGSPAAFSLWRRQPAPSVFAPKHSNCSSSVCLRLARQADRWAVRLLSEEVRAEWSACGGVLEVHCNLLPAEGASLLPGALRLTAFRREVAAVLDAVADQEADFIRRYPHLRWAGVSLHYHDASGGAYAHHVGSLSDAARQLLSGPGRADALR